MSFLRKTLCILALTFVGVFTSAQAADKVVTEAELAANAPETLRTAEWFALGGVGVACATSHEELSLRALITRPDAVPECLKLIDEATTAGKLYGLLGLRLMDDPSFRNAVTGFRRSVKTVRRLQACTPVTVSVSRVAKEIQDMDPDLAGKAPEILKNAEVFASGRVGFTGEISRNEKALNALLQRPDALEECVKLTKKATPAGQLYGLLGLKHRDKNAYKNALPRYLASHETVRTQHGCIISPTIVSVMATNIEAGKCQINP